MRRTTTLAAGMALAMLLVAPGAGAQGFGRRPGRGPGFGPGLTQALDLSEEQQVAIDALRTEMQRDLADVRALLREKRAELAELWRAGTPDRDAILAKHEEMDRLREEVRGRRVGFRLAVYALLTPEQQALATDWFAARGPGRRGRWMDRGPDSDAGWGRGRGAGRGRGRGRGNGAGFGRGRGNGAGFGRGAGYGPGGWDCPRWRE